MATVERSSSYGLRVQLECGYAEAVGKVTEALKTQGFGVLTEINVKDTFKKKLDREFTPFVILGACNPNLAWKAFAADLDVGLLLPCNVTVYTHPQSGKTMVGVIDPLAMMAVTGKPELEAVAQEARTKLEAALAAL